MLTDRIISPSNSPFLHDLGVRVALWEAGRCELSLDIQPRHLNAMSLLQGGVIATLLDTACGYAGVMAEPDGHSGGAVTVTLTINYLSKVAAGRIHALGVVSRVGKRLYFADGTLTTADGRLVAKAHGVFQRAKQVGRASAANAPADQP